ncbi:MAG: hypothetical protein A2168_08845 [Planctomycetes bacterium RBG_13_50_24]|nr:MAG: hypothetical protein A2168_08845 [Planctomycetes bacterium RBG_13_50_24]
MKPAKRIEDIVRNVRTTTSEATDERIISIGEAAMAKRNEQQLAAVHTGSGIRRIIMKSNWIKLAAASVIIAAIGLGMYALTGSIDGTSITMAQVRQAMQDIDWMQIVNEGDKIDDGLVEVDWYSFASKVHIVLAKGRIVYDDFKTRKQFHWPPSGEYIYESPIDQTREFAHGVTGPFEMIDKTFRIVQAEHDANVTKEVGNYQGQRVEVWKISHDVKSGGGRTLTVYIDIESKLPIAATYEHTRPDGTLQPESNIEFKYPETGPADIYEAGAPRSAQIKTSPEQ